MVPAIQNPALQDAELLAIPPRAEARGSDPTTAAPILAHALSLERRGLFAEARGPAKSILTREIVSTGNFRTAGG
jgi:hypothetical protein